MFWSDTLYKQRNTKGVSMSGKTRGVNKKERWKHDGPCSVIKLNLDVSGSFKTQTRVQNLFSAMFNLRRTLQKDTIKRINIYHHAPKERARDKTVQVVDKKTGECKDKIITGSELVRTRIGLSQDGLAKQAKKHVENSQWMGNHISKALALPLSAAQARLRSRALSPRRLGAN